MYCPLLVSSNAWDCASTSNTGTGLTRSSDCTISGGNHVAVSNTLEITGSSTDMNNLVTITAASNKRHFYVNGVTDKLILRFIKLTGGDVSGYADAPDAHGGSILIWTSGGTLVLYKSVIANNKANNGGGIFAKGDVNNLNATITSINGTNMMKNEALNHGGGMAVQWVVLTMGESIVSSNACGDTGKGGGLYIQESSSILQKSVIKRNTAYQGGGLAIHYSSYLIPTTVDIRETTFTDNAAQIQGGGIHIYGATRANVNITRSNIKNNTVITNSTIGINGGGGIYLASKTNVSIRQTSFMENIAKNNRGYEICTRRDNVDFTPTVTVVNTYFNQPTNNNSFYAYGAAVPLEMGQFGGAEINGNTYKFPSTAENWALFYNTTASPLTFQNPGTIIFNYNASNGDVVIYFKLRYKQYPDFDPSYTTNSFTCSGTGTAEIGIPSQGNNTFSHIEMFLTTKDIPVELTNIKIYDDTQSQPLWTTCTSSSTSPCTETPFTGTCTDSSSGNVKLGVQCQATCLPSELYYYSKGTIAGCSATIREWNCGTGRNTGTFIRSSDCTISGGNHVAVSNTLEITGSSTDMNNLVTITAASNKRHFYVNGVTDKLILRFIKLTGGDVSGYADAPDAHGGSILIWTSGGTLVLYKSVIANNKANNGGGIFAKGDVNNLNATITSINGTNMMKNEALNHGGGMAVQWVVLTMGESIVSSNACGDTGKGGGLYIQESSSILQKSVIKRNTAYQGGGLAIHYSSYLIPTTVDIRETTFTDNAAQIQGGGIHIYGATRANVNITRSNIKNNTVITNSTIGINGGGGIYLASKTNVSIRQTSFMENIAKNNRGYEICTRRDNVDFTPTVTVVNTYFNQPTNNNSFYAYGAAVPLEMGQFGGAEINGNTYKFPSTAENWALFYNTTASPLTFQNPGTIIFNYNASNGDVVIYFKLRYKQYPDFDPSYTTNSFTCSGTGTAEIGIPSQGNNTFSHIEM
eukprot:g6519.t1